MLLLALLMVVVSGLIAYIGDLIGRKMGRKRLTLLGLRPRHTAIVVSVTAGMLIAILTLATALAVSKPIRDAFITPREELITKLNSARQEADRMTRQLDVERNKLNEANAQLQRAMTQQQAIQAQLAGGREKLAAVQHKLQANQAQLVKVENDLTRFSAKLTDEAKKMQGLMTEKLRLEEEKQRLERERDALGGQIAALNPLIVANFTPLAFVSGQEIVSGLLSVKGTPIARKGTLRRLLATAERVVRQQCAQLPATDKPIVFLREKDKQMVTISEDEAIAILSDRIARLDIDGEAILRLAPANNVPVNGQAFIAVDFVEIIPNIPVYGMGGPVARVVMEITPQTSIADILGRLVDDLLREQVPLALRKKQMPMILRRYDPHQPNAVPSAALSLVSWTELMTAAEKAQTLSGRVSITAVSRNGIKRFDPLKLALEVAPAP